MEKRMAKIEKKNPVKPKIRFGDLPFTKINYQILGGALVCLVLGYFALGQEPWNGTLPLVIAPILLVIGYCILIPLGILYKRNQTSSDVS
jgi:hypothetical protein